MTKQQAVVTEHTLSISEEYDLFHRGENYHAYRFMGAHCLGDDRYVFRVWAPCAKSVSVVGDFDGWDRDAHPMSKVSYGGIWEVQVADLNPFALYKACGFEHPVIWHVISK